MPHRLSWFAEKWEKHEVRKRQTALMEAAGSPRCAPATAGGDPLIVVLEYVRADGTVCRSETFQIKPGRT